MKNIKQLFRRNPDLLETSEVKQLINYIQELEGGIFENNLKQDKQHIFKGIVEDIVISCKEYRENKLLEERYPDQYQKIDADHLNKTNKKSHKSLVCGMNCCSITKI